MITHTWGPGRQDMLHFTTPFLSVSQVVAKRLEINLSGFGERVEFPPNLGR
jgi:hypothetical protein